MCFIEKPQNCMVVFYKPLSLVFFIILSYCAVAVLFPFTGPYGTAYGVAILAVFLFTFLTFSFFLSFLGIDIVDRLFFNYEKSRKSKLPFVISIIGIIFLIIDRTYFREIYFIQMTAAEIRNKISAGNAGGISSPFSLLGNLMQCFVIISAYNSIMKDTGFRFLYKQALFFGVVTASSYILGGRTPLLAYLVITFSIYITSGRSNSVWAAIKFILPPVVLALVFALFIFSLRASAVGIDSSDYLSTMLVHLGSVNVNSSTGGSFLEDIVNYSYVIIAYLVHPFWVSSQIVIDPSGEGIITFYTLGFLFSKFIPVDLGSARHAYYQLFASLPGGLYYDFGLLGVCLYSMFLSTVGFLGIVVLAVSRGVSILGRILIIFCLSTLLLSPLLHSMNFAFFIFYIGVLFLYALYRDFLRFYPHCFFARKDGI